MWTCLIGILHVWSSQYTAHCLGVSGGILIMLWGELGNIYYLDTVTGRIKLFHS